MAETRRSSRGRARPPSSAAILEESWVGRTGGKTLKFSRSAKKGKGKAAPATSQVSAPSPDYTGASCREEAREELARYVVLSSEEDEPALTTQRRRRRRGRRSASKMDREKHNVREQKVKKSVVCWRKNACNNSSSIETDMNYCTDGKMGHTDECHNHECVM